MSLLNKHGLISKLFGFCEEMISGPADCHTNDDPHPIVATIFLLADPFKGEGTTWSTLSSNKREFLTACACCCITEEYCSKKQCWCNV